MSDEQLFRCVADAGRVVDDKGLGVDMLQQVGRRDVGHVERRILAHQDHIHGRKVDGLGRTEAGVVAQAPPQLEASRAGKHAAGAEAQIARQVMVETVAAILGLEAENECAVGLDIDGLDRIHLNGDGDAHRYPS